MVNLQLVFEHNLVELKQWLVGFSSVYRDYASFWVNCFDTQSGMLSKWKKKKSAYPFKSANGQRLWKLKRVTQCLSAVSPLKRQEMTLGLVCDKICPFYAAILNRIYENQDDLTYFVIL